MFVDEIDGVRLADLVFETIGWTLERTRHVEQRAQRKRSTEYAPLVEDAPQACQDPSRLIARAGGSVVVLGYSPSAERVLFVALVPSGHASEGAWFGVTARAARRDERAAWAGSQRREKRGSGDDDQL